MTIYELTIDEIIKQRDQYCSETAKTIMEGMEYAIKEDWEKVDNEIVPKIKEEFEREKKDIAKKYEVVQELYQMLGCGCDKIEKRGCSCNAPEGACDNIRDYAATIVTDLIKDIGHVKAGCRNVVREEPVIITKLKDVAYTDRNPFARMRASMALLEAEELGYVGELNYKNLEKNFRDAIKEDPEVEEIIKPYLKGI